MGCPHSNTDAPCADCAAAGVTRTGGEPNEDVDGQTLRRLQEGAVSGDDGPLGTTEKIGRYVVLDVLGRGGMGMVYTAHDPVLNRRVAIKVLRTRPAKGSQTSSGDSTRLLREAQAMAQLSHPNVVPVYDFGVAGADVFVAMELVVGTTLWGWLKEKRPGFKQVLPVFIAAGRGLQAAHEAGLVHRDFKPANVLLDQQQRPRVTDFGLARSVRSISSDTPGDGPVDLSGPISLDTPLTRAGQIMGSPGYMAPEQYDGAATTPATDQYAFCVSLYEALYGARPFRGPDLKTLGALTRDGKVPPPPKGSPVPPWIFPIVSKGLSPDAANRHPSMAALLDALSRDPARARNLWLAATAGLAIAVGVVGTWQWFAFSAARECRASGARLSGVWDEGVRGVARKAFEATGRSYAAVSWEHARDAMNAYATSWVEARVEACEATRVRGEQSERQLLLRLDCLDRRRDELATLAAAFSQADATLVGQASSAVTRLSPINTCANLQVLESRARLEPAARDALERLQREVAQGRLLVAAGRLKTAREKIEPAVREATAQAVPAVLAEAWEAKGELERASANYAEARAAYEHATEAALAAGEDGAAARHLAWLVSLVGWRLERPTEGLMLAAVARGLLVRQGGDRAIEAQLDEGVGDAQWQQGDRSAALASYRKALGAMRALYGDENTDVARLRSSVGWVLNEQGHLEEARELLQESQLVRARLLGKDHPQLATSWNELGSLAMQLGDTSEAVRCYRSELKIREQAFEAGSRPLGRALLDLAEALAIEGQVEEARGLLARAEPALATLTDSKVTARVQWVRTQARCSAGSLKWVEARKSAEEAVATAAGSFGAVHPETAICTLLLGQVLAGGGQNKEAVVVFDRFLEMAPKLGLPNNPDVPRALVGSAQALVALGRAGEAVPRLERALALFASLSGQVRWRADAQLALADAFAVGRGDLQRARALAEQARQGYATLAREADGERAKRWLDAHR